MYLICIHIHQVLFFFNLHLLNVMKIFFTNMCRKILLWHQNMKSHQSLSTDLFFFVCGNVYNLRALEKQSNPTSETAAPDCQSKTGKYQPPLDSPLL